jgi:alginate O-acetyltransferase complex protein AlgI
VIFNTPWFLLFTIVFLLFYLLFSPARYRPYLLLVGSVIFHAHFAGPAGMAPVLVVAAITFVIGILIDESSPASKRRVVLLVLGLSIPVLVLCLYKYAHLLFGVFVEAPTEYSLVGLSIPLAISFFTFEFVHYLTDVYKGSRAIRNPFHFGLFTVFFPSLVSGPIKRFQDFIPQIAKPIARPDSTTLMMGFQQVVIGFAKKLIVADNASIACKLIEAQPEQSPLTVLALMGLLSVRILFDFSGYSDIAIGLARLLGIRIPPNFNFPYAARNLADFWRRWHISLSSWIRDYLYIPLGGSRHGWARKCFNLLIAMFICGMWHGPEWHFGVWGIYHGLGLGVHTVWSSSGIAARLANSRVCSVISWAFTNLFVAYGWLIFFYPIKRVWSLTMSLFGLG